MWWHSPLVFTFYRTWHSSGKCPISIATSWLTNWCITLRCSGMNVVFMLHFMADLREDRKGLSLGTDILWQQDTPHSHRQDLIFTFSQRGREGKQASHFHSNKRSAWVIACRERSALQWPLRMRGSSSHSSSSCPAVLYLSTMNFCLLDVWLGWTVLFKQQKKNG